MRLASCSTVLKVHDWPDGDLVSNYEPSTKYEGAIRSMSWSKDGMWMIIVPISGIPEVVSIKDQQPKQLIAIKDFHSTCAAFQNTIKKTVVLGTSMKEVLVYDIKSKQVRKQYDAGSSMINHVEYTAKDSHIAAGCENGEIHLYSNTVNKLSLTCKIPKSTCCTSLRCHATKRNHILGGSYEGIVAFFDTNVGKVIYTNQAHVAAVSGLTFSPLSNDLIASTGLDRRLVFHDVSTKARVAEIIVENTGTSVDFAPDGFGVAVACNNGSIYVYDARKLGAPLNRFEAHTARINSVLFQKRDEGTSSSFSLQAEENVTAPESDFQDANASSKTGESFSYSIEMFSNQSLPKTVEEKSTQEAGDSFMAALGLNMTDSKNASIASKSSTTSTVVMTNENKPVDKSLSNLLKPGISSTPKYILETQAGPGFSPVISGSMQNQSNNNTVSVKPIIGVSAEEIRQIVHTEVNECLNKYKKEISLELYDVVSQMRRNFLDLHMSIVKESVHMENNLNRLTQELLVEDPCYSENMLIQENYRLRKEVMMLKEKLEKSD